MTAIIQQAPTGRADLLRALVAQGEDGLRAAADLLGFVEVPAEMPPLRLEEPVNQVTVSEKTAQTISPTPTHIEYDDIPFWRAVAVERAEDHEPGDEPLELLTPEMLTRDADAVPPERPPLVAWPVLRRVLDDRLRAPRESHRIDANRLATWWSRGRVPRRLPREVRRHLGRVSLIVDRDRRLAPFWDDQADVVRELVSSLPPTDLRLLPSPFDGTMPLCTLDENDVVLVLGDLGFYADSSRHWLRLARCLRRTGARLWALVPCPPRRWHRATAQAWSATDWSAPHLLSSGGHVGSFEAATEQMLRLLAMAVRIEPGLVRELRRLVPTADCAVEVDLQHHEDLATGSSSAWQFTGAAIQRWRAELVQLPYELRCAVAEVMIRWHRHLSAEVRIELSEVLRTVDVQLDGDLGVTEEDARRIFEGVAAILEQSESADGRMVSAISTWLPRVGDQLPPAAWRGRLGRPLVRAFQAYREKYPDTALPPGVTTEMLSSGRSDGPIERWDVRQRGDRLRIEPANAWGAGSFLATLSARDSKIWLASERQIPEQIDLDQGIELPAEVGQSFRLVSDVEEVVFESTPGPPWAARVGRDGHGLWAAFEFHGIEQRMRWIPPGRFWMGSPEDEDGRDTDEGPRHLVSLTEGFWMAETPCIQALWDVVMGENPSRFEGTNRPVEQVSWQEVQAFLDRLSFQVRGLDGRLPTEAEWEHACRGGTETPTWLGKNDAEVLDQISVYNGNSGGGTQKVSGRGLNPRGLCDMLGNLYEWCWDWQSSYSTSSAIDPEGPGSGSGRLLRGGSWASHARDVRAASRRWDGPGYNWSDAGFRLSSGPGERGASVRMRADVAPQAARRGTSRRARSRRLHGWVDRIKWAVDGGSDAYGRWAALEIAGVVHRLRWIYPGRFRMGSPETEVGRFADEGPLHTVEFPEGFWLGESPCTQALYEAVMDENPSHFRSAERPVEQVSWEDCQRFFEELRTKAPEFVGRLPSEAQWEFACRAGTMAATWDGNLEILGERNAPLLDEIAWYSGNSGVEFELANGWDSSDWSDKQIPHERAGTHRVGMKRPNPWGLHDMLGNVWEWCEDTWDGQSGYPDDDRVDPVGADGSVRVLRGGSWDSLAWGVRAAYRNWVVPGDRHSSLGFRLSSGSAWRRPE